MNDQDWERVFKIRCKSKRGELFSEDERKFLIVAYNENPDRYSAMDDRIFEETAPFGSTIRCQ